MENVNSTETKKPLYGGGGINQTELMNYDLVRENENLKNTVKQDKKIMASLNSKINAMKKPTRHFTKCFNAECYKLLRDKRFTTIQRGIILSLSCLVRGYADNGKISFIEGENLVNPKTKGSITSWRELAECLNLSKTNIKRPKKALKFLEDDGIITTWQKEKNVLLFFTNGDKYFSATRE